MKVAVKSCGSQTVQLVDERVPVPLTTSFVGLHSEGFHRFNCSYDSVVSLKDVEGDVYSAVFTLYETTLFLL